MIDLYSFNWMISFRKHLKLSNQEILCKPIDQFSLMDPSIFFGFFLIFLFTEK